ncbi:MAG: alpha/beta hydrolase [Fimbriimonadaceae bacterium]|nr:alpha/beta hydrolase [Fimbriimonadaceae bacterium]
MTREAWGFHHRFEPGEGRVLVLLHGTGADENDLVPLARSLEHGAAILSPRGKSLDEGSPRWFRRFGEGRFDLEDLAEKSRELAEFLQTALSELAPGLPTTALGYSNGANMAAALMLAGLWKPDAAVLLRPMIPFEPESLPDLAGTRILIAAGKHDLICRPSAAMRLEDALRDAGADVDILWSEAGHGLTREDILAVAEFLGEA